MLTPMLRWGLKIWCSKSKAALYLSNIIVFMQLPTPTPTQQLQPVQLHPLSPQNQPSQLEHPIPHPLGSPFRHSPQARVDLSKVRRRRRCSQTPPRQPEDTRTDVVSGYIYRRTLTDAEQVVVEKARIVEQDGFITRQCFEAKDGAMEALQKEADRLLKEKDDTIHTLRAEV